VKAIIEGADYFVRIVTFPTPAGGMLALNEDGTYSMYLNDAYMAENRLEHYMHEYDHIANDDMYGDRDIMEIEKGLRRGA